MARVRVTVVARALATGRVDCKWVYATAEGWCQNEGDDADARRDGSAHDAAEAQSTEAGDSPRSGLCQRQCVRCHSDTPVAAAKGVTVLVDTFCGWG